MPRQRLQNLAEQLQDELARPEGLDDNDNDLLRELQTGIGGLLAASTDTGRHRTSESVIERMRFAVARFEGDHPKIAAAIRDGLDALSGAGI